MTSILASRSDFDSALLNFLEESNACPTERVKWQLGTNQSLVKRLFLKREIEIAISQTANELDDGIDIEFEDVIENDFAVAENNSIAAAVTTAIHLEQHIAYSTSYQVPVLYFRASFASNGAPLTLEDIHNHVVSKSVKQINGTTPLMITQNEHPVLNTPYWYIHPCDTRALMSTLSFAPVDYIKTWLSVYGPLVKCPISINMFRGGRDIDQLNERPSEQE